MTVTLNDVHARLSKTEVLEVARPTTIDEVIEVVRRAYAGEIRRAE